MRPYAYSIPIRRKPQTIHWRASKDFETLSLEILRPFVGDGAFEIEETNWNAGQGDGYRVTVRRSRLETPEECKSRVSGEVAYMAEFKKRKAARDAHTAKYPPLDRS